MHSKQGPPFRDGGTTLLPSCRPYITIEMIFTTKHCQKLAAPPPTSFSFLLRSNVARDVAQRALTVLVNGDSCDILRHGDLFGRIQW